MSADSIEVVEIGSHLQRMKEIVEEAVSGVLVLPVGENKEQNTDIKSLAHTKWNCKYHVVFAPKYRRKVFYQEKCENTVAIKSYIANRLKQDQESDQLTLFDPRDPFTGSK